MFIAIFLIEWFLHLISENHGKLRKNDVNVKQEIVDIF